ARPLITLAHRSKSSVRFEYGSGRSGSGNETVAGRASGRVGVRGGGRRRPRSRRRGGGGGGARRGPSAAWHGRGRPPNSPGPPPAPRRRPGMCHGVAPSRVRAWRAMGPLQIRPLPTRSGPRRSNVASVAATSARVSAVVIGVGGPVVLGPPGRTEPPFRRDD